jgi:uncharacterized repeat protein (TIGR01451 family)
MLNHYLSFVYIPPTRMKKTAHIIAALLLSGFMPVLAQAQTYNSNYITRADFVRMVMEQKGGAQGGGTNCFRDVGNQAYAMYVCAAKQRGIVTGKPDGSFMPNQQISFIEAAAVVVRAEVGSVPNTGTMWYTPYLQQLSTWNAVPASVHNILDMMTYSQAQELISAAMNRGSNGSSSSSSSSSSSAGSTTDNNNDDVKLSIDVSDSTPEAGDRITYRIRLKNEDNDDIEDLEVSAELDDDMDFISASDDGEDDDQDVEWEDIEIEEDETTTLLLTVEIDDNADDGDTLRLRVEADDSTVTRTIRISDDSNNDNDGDLSISISDSPDPVEAGDIVTYRITVENEDNDDMDDITVVAELDDNMEFISASDDGDESRDEVEWDNIDLDEDESKTFELRVRVDNDVDDGDEIRLIVKSEGEEETEETEVNDDDNDDDNDNDDDDEDVTISITDSEDPADIGDQVTYRITIENNENHDVTVDVSAEFDDAMSFLSASVNGRLVGDDGAEWDNIEIEEDEERVLLLTLRVTQDADDGDNLRMTVEAGNDEDTETTSIRD